MESKRVLRHSQRVKKKNKLEYEHKQSAGASKNSKANRNTASIKRSHRRTHHDKGASVHRHKKKNSLKDRGIIPEENKPPVALVGGTTTPQPGKRDDEQFPVVSGVSVLSEGESNYMPDSHHDGVKRHSKDKTKRQRKKTSSTDAALDPMFDFTMVREVCSTPLLHKELVDKVVEKEKERKKEKEKKSQPATMPDAKSMLLLDMPRMGTSKRTKKVKKDENCLEEPPSVEDVLKPKKSADKLKTALPAAPIVVTPSVVEEELVADEKGRILMPVMNNENKGELFMSDAEPFWSCPLEPTDNDLDGVEEPLRVSSDTLNEIQMGKAVLATMPSTPVVLNSTLPINELRNRDKFFSIGLVFSNTVRSVVNINAELPKSQENMRRRRKNREENGDVTQIDDDGIRFVEPKQVYVYSRIEPLRTAREKKTVDRESSN